jgi:hypothetical protein
VEKLQREYEILDEKIIENNTKFESISKAVSDTSSVTNIKQAIQKLNVFINFILL